MPQSQVDFHDCQNSLFIRGKEQTRLPASRFVKSAALSAREQAVFSLSRDYISDALTSLPIPERRYSSLLRSSLQHLGQLRAKLGAVATNEHISTHRNRDRPFRVLADRKTRYAEIGRLFLNAAGIGDDHGRPGLEGKKVNVGEGV